MYQSYNLLAATMIAKIRNIKLKHTILVSFLFLFPLQPNIATEQPNDEDNIIKKVTKKILGEKGSYLFGFRGNIIDWISTSTYNYYTDHNLRKTGWYHGKFYIYGGIKFKITKNLFLDVYYSFLKLIPFYIIDLFIFCGLGDILKILISFITISINIRINKNFYLSISPIHYILFKLIELRKYAYFRATS